MKKGLVKIIEKARNKNLPEECLKYLEELEKPLYVVENLYVFLKERNGNGLLNFSEDIGLFYEIMDRGFSKYRMGNYYNSFPFLFGKLGNEDSGWFLMIEEEELLFCTLLVFLSNNITKEEALEISKTFYKRKTIRESGLFNTLSYLSSFAFEKDYEDSENKEALKEKIRNCPIKEKVSLFDYFLEERDIDKNEEDYFHFNTGLDTKVIKTILKEKCVEDLERDKKNKEIILSFFEESPFFGKEEVGFITEKEGSLKLVKTILNQNESVKSITLEVEPHIRTLYRFCVTSVQVSFSKVNKVTAKRNPLSDENESYFLTGKPYFLSESEYVLFLDSFQFYKKLPKGNLVAASIKDIAKSYQEFGEAFGELFRFVSDYHFANGSKSYRDLLVLIKENPASRILPLTIKDFYGKNSWNDVFRCKYKKDFPVNWNKVDVCFSYMCYKALPLLKEEDRGRVFDIVRKSQNGRYSFDVMDFFRKMGFQYRLNSIICVSYLIFKNIQEHEEKRHDIPVSERTLMFLSDYVDISRKMKRKIGIRIQSEKKIKEKHDKVSFEYTIKKTPKVTVPKDSVFKDLRKALPEEFEWIKTRKRLIEEGLQMNHCVASYADRINKDRSAIYSFFCVEDKKRYTIEFIWSKKDGYVIRQMKGFNNEEPSEFSMKKVYSLVSGVKGIAVK